MAKLNTAIRSRTQTAHKHSKTKSVPILNKFSAMTDDDVVFTTDTTDTTDPLVELHDQLKRCPVCNQRPTVSQDNAKIHARIECMNHNCSSQPHTGMIATRQAIIEWNNKLPSPLPF
ncbi:MAG: hypothetical protein Q7R33_04960 [Nitrosarchaeum sp.]|nr:hypothetical protein [Nitrosarchaeum sp.]